MDVYQALVRATANFLMRTHSNFMNNKEAEPERLLVHCRAGIGRTGTTVSLINAVLQIYLQNGVKFEVKEPQALS